MKGLALWLLVVVLCGCATIHQKRCYVLYDTSAGDYFTGWWAKSDNSLRGSPCFGRRAHAKEMPYYDALNELTFIREHELAGYANGADYPIVLEAVR